MTAILVSTVMQGTSLVIVKRINHPVSPISLTLGGLLFGILLLVPLALISEDATKIRFDPVGIGSIAFLGILGTIVALVVYYWLMKKVEIVYLSLVSFVTPVVAVMFGTMILGEELSSRVFVGAAFVLTGILAANGEIILRAMQRNSSMDGN